MTEARHILIVDDDPDIRLITELALQLDAGLAVRSVASTPEALDLLAGDCAVDAVLADMHMPGQNGLELMRRLRRLEGREALPVVFFTASVGGAELESFASAGAQGLIAKPYDPLTLGAELRRILAL